MPEPIEVAELAYARTLSTDPLLHRRYSEIILGETPVVFPRTDAEHKALRRAIDGALDPSAGSPFRIH